MWEIVNNFQIRDMKKELREILNSNRDFFILYGDLLECSPKVVLLTSIMYNDARGK